MRQLLLVEWMTMNLDKSTNSNTLVDLCSLLIPITILTVRSISRSSDPGIFITLTGIAFSNKVELLSIIFNLMISSIMEGLPNNLHE